MQLDSWGPVRTLSCSWHPSRVTQHNNGGDSTRAIGKVWERNKEFWYCSVTNTQLWRDVTDNSTYKLCWAGQKNSRREKSIKYWRAAWGRNASTEQNNSRQYAKITLQGQDKSYSDLCLEYQNFYSMGDLSGKNMYVLRFPLYTVPTRTFCCL